MSQRSYKYSVILNNYNKPSDRFMAGGYGYAHQQRGALDLIAFAGQQGLVEGLEMIFEPEAQGESALSISPLNVKTVAAAAADQNLPICSLIPNLWGLSPEQGKATIGSADPTLRRQSIDLCKQAVDVAAEAGCPYVGIWPGQDGYDYTFEADYRRLYDCWVEGLGEIARHNPSVKVGLEPKPDEPRGFSFINTPAKALLLIDDVGEPNLGITLDVGHSFYGHENLGDTVALMHRRGGKLFHCHMNDNYNSADLDMIFGSVHTIEFLEFFYWLRRTGYAGYLSVDLFAYRTDPADSVAEAVRWMQTFDALIDRIGMDALGALLDSGSPTETTRFLREQLFGR